VTISIQEQYASHQSTGPLACLLLVEWRNDETEAKREATVFDVLRADTLFCCSKIKDLSLSHTHTSSFITNHGSIFFLCVCVSRPYSNFKETADHTTTSELINIHSELCILCAVSLSSRETVFQKIAQGDFQDTFIIIVRAVT